MSCRASKDMTRPVYVPWMFDNRKAWEYAIADEDYHYDMPFDDFMKLYKYYRNHGETPVIIQTPPIVIQSKKESNIESQLLTQKEIDDLIKQLVG